MSLNRHIQSPFRTGHRNRSGHRGKQNVNNILTRRSQREFTEDAVPQDMLDTLLACAFSAPSKSDLQQACVIHLRDREKQRRIASATASTRWAAEAPVLRSGAVTAGAFVSSRGGAGTPLPTITWTRS